MADGPVVSPEELGIKVTNKSNTAVPAEQKGWSFALTDDGNEEIKETPDQKSCKRISLPKSVIGKRC